MTDSAKDADVERAIQAGCAAADVHLRCSYPECGCKQLPTAVRAAIAAIEAGRAAAIAEDFPLGLKSAADGIKWQAKAARPAPREAMEQARELRRQIRAKFETEDHVWRTPVSQYALTEAKADGLLAAALTAREDKGRREALEQAAAWHERESAAKAEIRKIIEAAPSPDRAALARAIDAKNEHERAAEHFRALAAPEQEEKG